MEKVLPTRAVKAVITNEQGAILFLQRNGSARADGQSNWDLPGGLVEDDESDITALTREVEEELGRKAEVGQLLGKWSFLRKFDEHIIEVTNYAVSLDTYDTAQFKLSEEHTSFDFIGKTALQNLEVKDPSIFNALGV